jgi:AraC family transcriptional regulator, regulatory protein of adaptative response / methylated-DNA-[protein]-cysteine methyltransferase
METSISNAGAGKNAGAAGRSSKCVTDDNRWERVACRDREADGQFFYGVRSTGIYCRPSCAARLARRENVTFFTSCAAAEAAGFRPCKRCQPKGPALRELYATAVARACRLIQAAEKPPSLGWLAKRVGMSPFHFHRVFKNCVGLTPKAYASAWRAERVRNELARRPSVTEALYEAGYNASSRFYAKSSAMLGMKPNQFRQHGAGASIRFAAGQCSLGRVLVAASERGVCAILLGDNRDELVKDLRRRFHEAELVAGDRDFERLVARVIRLVEKPQAACHLPLDIRGTAFQHRVWEALRRIPAGHTMSYTELADSIGMPQAVRAVANACAANPLAVAIPCHRVRRADGSLSGYRWGMARKRALLEREASGSKN